MKAKFWSHILWPEAAELLYNGVVTMWTGKSPALALRTPVTTRMDSVSF